MAYSPLLQIRIEFYKRKIFDFVVCKDDKKNEKQEQALKILTDNEHSEFLYGGAAGGSKSWTGCAFLLFMCLIYPGTKWFIGRDSLKKIRETTLLSFYKVCSAYGIKRDVDFTYNGQDHCVQFTNGSRIDLLDLRYLPSDPMYERFGSFEFTGGWIEEGGEVKFGAYDVLKTRIGRHFNDKYGILRKLFITCNPKKNWIYTTFYEPAVKHNRLPSHMAYLQCKANENIFIEQGYTDALNSISDKVTRERLRDGNWEYDDNPNALCSYDNLSIIFNNDLAKKTNQKYITVDAARFGSDKARILVWDGYVVIEQLSFDVSATTDIQLAITHLRRKYRIPTNKTIVDDDGVGGGIVDNCNVIGFVNNSSPFAGENYYNLQAQCAYKIAEHINNGDVGFEAEISQQEKEDIITELEQLQTWDIDSDRKLRIKPKEEIKNDIGHSPDWRDAILMRAYFDYKDLPEGVAQRNAQYLL